MTVEKLPEVFHIILDCVTTHPMRIAVIEQRFKGIRNTVFFIKKRQYISNIFPHARMLITSFFFVFGPHLFIGPEVGMRAVVWWLGFAFVELGEGVKWVISHDLIFCKTKITNERFFIVFLSLFW